jgi:hypothetical protein
MRTLLWPTCSWRSLSYLRGDKRNCTYDETPAGSSPILVKNSHHSWGSSPWSITECTHIILEATFFGVSPKTEENSTVRDLKVFTL